MCSGGRSTVVRVYDYQRIAATWLECYGIDISAAVPPEGRTSLYGCADCDLAFFSPAIAGSGAFYALLQRLDWYYPPFKWEHRSALADLRPGDRVLEVGCGTGDFVQTMRDAGFNAQGVELNPDAVSAARAKGRPVEGAMLSDLIARGEAPFDVVLAFQVLEHVPSPGEFLRECAALLKTAPGSRLILGVPNREGYLANMYDVFDLPPHHMSRWSPDAMAGAARALRLRVRRVEREPLADGHLLHWAGGKVGRWTGREHVSSRPASPGARALAFAVRRCGLQSRLTGHTLYACLERQ